MACQTCANAAPPKPAPEAVQAFDALTARILASKGRGKKPYGDYIKDKKKKASGFLAASTHLLPTSEFREAYKADRKASIDARYDKKLADAAEKQKADLVAAQKLPEPKRSESITAINNQYATDTKFYEIYRRQETTMAAVDSSSMHGFVGTNGETYIDMEGQGVAHTAHHESLHRLTSPAWDKGIDAAHDGHNLDEAVTEHFTRQLGYDDAGARSQMRPEYSLGSDLVAKRYSEDALASAYFGGDFSKMEKEHPIKNTKTELNKAVDAAGGNATFGR